MHMNKSFPLFRPLISSHKCTQSIKRPLNWVRFVKDVDTNERTEQPWRPEEDSVSNANR